MKHPVIDSHVAIDSQEKKEYDIRGLLKRFNKLNMKENGKMKKAGIILAVLVLTLVSVVSGLAEPTKTEIFASSSQYNLYGETIGFRMEGDDVYTLVDAAGKPLTTAPYTYMSSVSGSTGFRVEVAAEDGLHGKGLIDDFGKEIIPPVYADVKKISEHWAAGVKLVPATESDYDYKLISFGSDAENPFMMIDTVDIYFDGALVGTLTREDYADWNIPYGEYIYIRNRAHEHVFYNKNMEKSPWTAEGSAEYVESKVDGRRVIIHQGSGKKAFTPDCDLTEAEVKCPYMYKEGTVVGLQGQEILRPEKTYDNITEFTDGYAKTTLRTDEKTEYGIIDMNGKEIGPGGYDYVGEDDLATLAKYGATVLEKDEKYGIIDREGNVVVPFEYDRETYREAGNMIYLQQEDETYKVITPCGELPESYKEAELSPYEGRMLLCVKKMDDTVGVINWAGEEIIPFSENNVYMVNAMGTVVLTRESNNSFTIYSFDKADETAAPETQQETAETEAAAEDGTWTCANGHAGQKGNFCSECGSPRPAE